MILSATAAMRAATEAGGIAGLLAERCAALGLPCWPCDALGRVSGPPTAPPELAAFLGTPAWRERIERAAEAWVGRESHAAPVFPGCWVVPVIPRGAGPVAGGDATAGVLALVMTAAALGGPDFAALAAAAGADPADVRRALLPLIKPSPADLAHWATVLRWSHDDLGRARRDELTLAE